MSPYESQLALEPIPSKAAEGNNRGENSVGKSFGLEDSRSLRKARDEWDTWDHFRGSLRSCGRMGNMGKSDGFCKKV